MGQGLLAALAVAVALAGCINAPAHVDPVAQDDGQAVQVTADRPEPTFTANVTVGPAAIADEQATLVAPPVLQKGEWWRIQFHSPLDGMEAEFVRVIADVQDDGYVVGMPHEGWFKEGVVYHTPAFGDVAKDLSYETHDEVFQPVQFPLTDGATWESTFSGGGTMTAHVKVEDAHTARVTFTQPGGGLPFLGPTPAQPAEEQVVLELVYDATIHEVREFTHPTAEFQVVEHGYNFTGWVTVPRGEDLAFIHGRLAGLLGIGASGQGPLPPTETVEVAGGYNRLTFVQVVGSVVPAPGVYRETVAAPDGTEFVTEAVPGTGLTVAFFEFPDPDGTWEFTHLAAGPGIVFSEGIAYHQYDIHLPDGAKRTDHSHKVIR
jgi:hypothetical protein